VRAGIQKALRAADRSPATATFLLALVMFAALRTWSWRSEEPVLLARADPSRRIEIFGQFASTSVAVMAIALTVLAILYALPDRATFQDIRNSDTWPGLQSMLLMISLLSLVTLVCAHIGSAIDHHKPGIEWLEQIMLASAVTGLLAMVIAGLIFAAVLYVGGGPSDPSDGRGSLSGQV
jgi:hypothetical protein